MRRYSVVNAAISLTVALTIAILFPATSVAAESDFFDSDGVRLHYVSAGADSTANSSRTILLLHGFSGSAEGLYVKPGTLVTLADAGYRVIALDQVGHGKSDKPHDSTRYGLHMIEDLRRLLDHLGVEKVHLVGYSMGAKVANTFRDLYAERLNTIVLGGYGWPWQSSRLTQAEADARMRTRTVLPGNDIDALTAVSMGMHLLAPDEDSLRSNAVPALAIIGDKDAAVPAKDFETLSATMANLTTVVMPGTHAGPDGAPYKTRYAEELLRFLEANE